MHRDIETIHRHMQQLIDTLVDVAMADNQITEDEQNIIDSIKEGIRNLEEQVVQILSDDLDDHEFKDLIEQIMQDIIYNATQVANQDGIVTEDESKLLQKLREFSNIGDMLDE